MRWVMDGGRREGDDEGGVCEWWRRREEETDEPIKSEREGQLLGFETYAWQWERTGSASDRREGQQGVTAKEAKATMAGLGRETEEVEGCEEGRNLITAS